MSQTVKNHRPPLYHVPLGGTRQAGSMLRHSRDLVAVRLRRGVQTRASMRAARVPSCAPPPERAHVCGHKKGTHGSFPIGSGLISNELIGLASDWAELETSRVYPSGGPQASGSWAFGLVTALDQGTVVGVGGGCGAWPREAPEAKKVQWTLDAGEDVDVEQAIQWTLDIEQPVQWTMDAFREACEL